MRTEFLCISVLRVASGPRVKLASCKRALKPPAELTIFGQLKILMMFSINLNLKTFRLLNCLK